MVFLHTRKKILPLMIAAILITAMIAAISCSGPRGEQAGAEQANNGALAQAETLIVGSDTAYPPFSFLNEQGHADGFDIEIIKEVGQRLGKEVEIKSVPFDSLYQELNEGNIDVIISALTVAADRKNSVDYTDPYYVMEYLLLTLSDTEIRLREDMIGQEVGILRIDKGCLPEDALDRYQVAEYDDIRAMIESLRSRDLDGLIITKPFARNIMQQEGKMYRVLHTFQSERAFVIALPKNSGIKEDVNQILETMGRDGTLEDIYGRWLAMD